MSWDAHVNQLISFVSNCVGILETFRTFHLALVKLIIYNALFKSHLRYFVLVWGSTTETNTSDLYLSQKKAVQERNITDAEYFPPAEQWFRRPNLLPFNKHYASDRALRCKNSIHNNQSPFTQLLNSKNNAVFIITDQDYLNIPFCRMKYVAKCSVMLFRNY